MADLTQDRIGSALMVEQPRTLRLVVILLSALSGITTLFWFKSASHGGVSAGMYGASKTAELGFVVMDTPLVVVVSYTMPSTLLMRRGRWCTALAAVVPIIGAAAFTALANSSFQPRF